MAKDTFYFQHDYNARNDDKILELRAEFGVEGYAIYFMLLESMAETEDGILIATLLGGLSLGYGIAKDRLREIIDFSVKIELFDEKDGCFFSNRMLEHKKWRKSLSKSGSDGAKKRWSKNSPPISPPISPPNAQDSIEHNSIENDKDIGFEKFNKWILENSPLVAKMKEPFTVAQYHRLKDKHSVVAIQKALLDMHNWKELLKKKVSANLTIQTFLRNQPIAPEEKQKQKHVDVDKLYTE